MLSPSNNRSKGIWTMNPSDQDRGQYLRQRANSKEEMHSPLPPSGTIEAATTRDAESFLTSDDWVGFPTTFDNRVKFGDKVMVSPRIIKRGIKQGKSKRSSMQELQSQQQQSSTHDIDKQTDVGVHRLPPGDYPIQSEKKAADKGEQSSPRKETPKTRKPSSRRKRQSKTEIAFEKMDRIERILHQLQQGREQEAEFLHSNEAPSKDDIDQPRKDAEPLRATQAGGSHSPDPKSPRGRSLVSRRQSTSCMDDRKCSPKKTKMQPKKKEPRRRSHSPAVADNMHRQAKPDNPSNEHRHIHKLGQSFSPRSRRVVKDFASPKPLKPIFGEPHHSASLEPQVLPQSHAQFAAGRRKDDHSYAGDDLAEIYERLDWIRRVSHPHIARRSSVPQVASAHQGGLKNTTEQDIEDIEHTLDLFKLDRHDR